MANAESVGVNLSNFIFFNFESENTDDCDENFGICTNLDFNDDGAHYSCACKGGSEDMHGNGTLCREIDECSEAAYPHNCGQFTVCSNTVLSFECSCISSAFDGPGTGLKIRIWFEEDISNFSLIANQI